MGKRVAVIGGGISGLCVAYHLETAGVEVILFEASAGVGGNIRSEIRDGYLIEHGPNTVIANPELLELIDDLGISGEIARPDPDAKRRYILKNGKLAALPSTIPGILQNKTFSAQAKLRLLTEPFIRTKSPPGESVAAFFDRRIGKELVEYAVDPFISGIYAGDPHKLSIRHAFPKVFEYERNFGSIIHGALFSRKEKSERLPKGIPRSLTFKSGMQTLTDSISRKLGESVRVASLVETVARSGDGRLEVATADAYEVFDSVIVSTPAFAAARILGDRDTELADALAKIYYPPVSVVFTAYRREDVKREPDGFGFLVPSIEGRKILGTLWTSSVFENRAPEGYHLFTTFIGGSRNAELCDRSEAELREIAVEELISVLGIDGAPVFASAKKWDRAIPQYNVGYERVVAAVENYERANPGVYFCSNFYKGISVGDCLRNAKSTANEVLRQLFER